MNATERTGTIFLENTLKQGKHYPVRDAGDGPEYYLGDAARTKDGWVNVPESQRENIIWNN
jgi:hypothetical protein